MLGTCAASAFCKRPNDAEAGADSRHGQLADVVAGQLQRSTNSAVNTSAARGLSKLAQSTFVPLSGQSGSTRALSPTCYTH